MLRLLLLISITSIFLTGCDRFSGSKQNSPSQEQQNQENQEPIPSNPHHS